MLQRFPTPSEKIDQTHFMKNCPRKCKFQSLASGIILANLETEGPVWRKYGVSNDFQVLSNNISWGWSKEKVEIQITSDSSVSYGRRWLDYNIYKKEMKSNFLNPICSMHYTCICTLAT